MTGTSTRARSYLSKLHPHLVSIAPCLVTQNRIHRRIAHHLHSNSEACVCLALFCEEAAGIPTQHYFDGQLSPIPFPLSSLPPHPPRPGSPLEMPIALWMLYQLVYTCPHYMEWLASEPPAEVARDANGTEFWTNNPGPHPRGHTCGAVQ